MSMPHVYANQIEYCDKHLKYRDSVIKMCIRDRVWTNGEMQTHSYTDGEQDLSLIHICEPVGSTGPRHCHGASGAAAHPGPYRG